MDKITSRINCQQSDNYNDHILSLKKLKAGNTFKVALWVVSEDSQYQVQHQVQTLFVTGLKKNLCNHNTDLCEAASREHVKKRQQSFK